MSSNNNVLEVKDPNGVVDYSIDWSTYLEEDADTIETSTWTVPAGITKDSDSETNTVTTIWLSGGTAGEIYPLLNRITTAGGRTQDQTINIRVAER
jgi:hypothetical protein